MPKRTFFHGADRVVVWLSWSAHPLVKQKNGPSAARRSSSSSSAAGFGCLPAGWSLQTPPPPASETQHGCRSDGNKLWFLKYLKERKTPIKKRNDIGISVFVTYLVT